jgi:hypothetical protein
VRAVGVRGLFGRVGVVCGLFGRVGVVRGGGGGGDSNEGSGTRLLLVFEDDAEVDTKVTRLVAPRVVAIAPACAGGVGVRGSGSADVGQLALERRGGREVASAGGANLAHQRKSGVNVNGAGDALHVIADAGELDRRIEADAAKGAAEAGNVQGAEVAARHRGGRERTQGVIILMPMPNVERERGIRHNDASVSVVLVCRFEKAPLF